MAKEESTEQELRFVIDGREYPSPDMDEFTMGEALTLHEYTGLSLDEVDEDTPRMPLIAAFMHIAYARENAGVSDAKIKRIIKSSNIAEALEKVPDVEDDARPPDAPLSNDESTPSLLRSSSGNPKDSGNGSMTSSVPLVGVPSPIGISESDTPPIVGQETSRI